MGRWSGWWLVAIGLGVASCGGRSQHRADRDDGEVPDVAGDDDGTPEPEPEVPNCVDHELGDGLGTIMTGNNTSAPTGAGTTCGGGVGYHEVTFEWRAPAAGTYRIDTRDPDPFDVGRTFDTALGLRTPGCPGVELSCNDDYQDTTSGVVREFQAGEVVTIVLHSLSPADAGQYWINVEELSRATCPYAVALNGILPTEGRVFESACGGFGPAATMPVTLAELATIRVRGNGFTPAIQLRESCDGPVIACAASADGKTAELRDPSVVTGQPVLVIQRSESSSLGQADFSIDFLP
jgi:hypothetical protein